MWCCAPAAAAETRRIAPGSVSPVAPLRASPAPNELLGLSHPHRHPIPHQTSSDPMAMISFARGIPAPECLAVDDLAECAQAVLERDGHTILSYGPSPGYGPLREWLAARHGVEESRIFLTNGSLQGFVFLAQRLAPGKARPRRASDVRPAAEDPARVGRRDRPSALRRRRPRSGCACRCARRPASRRRSST